MVNYAQPLFVAPYRGSVCCCCRASLHHLLFIQKVIEGISFFQSQVLHVIAVFKLKINEIPFIDNTIVILSVFYHELSFNDCKSSLFRHKCPFLLLRCLLRVWKRSMALDISHRAARLLVVVLLGHLFVQPSVQQTCSWLSTCSCKLTDGTIINLAPLDNGSGRPRFTGMTENNQPLYTYDYNPCTPISNCADQRNTAMCQRSTSGVIIFSHAIELSL